MRMSVVFVIVVGDAREIRLDGWCIFLSDHTWDGESVLSPLSE